MVYEANGCFFKKCKRVFLSILLSFSLFLSSNTILNARPLSTDDAWTVEKGKFQVEVGFDGGRQDNHDKEYSSSLTLSYGLLERMDLGIGSGYLFIRPNS